MTLSNKLSCFPKRTTGALKELFWLSPKTLPSQGSLAWPGAVWADWKSNLGIKVMGFLRPTLHDRDSQCVDGGRCHGKSLFKKTGCYLGSSNQAQSGTHCPPAAEELGFESSICPKSHGSAELA